MSAVLVATFTCLGLDHVPCDATGTGDPTMIDKAAEKHTKTTGHGTSIHTRTIKEPK